jgi:hypothetical protein
MKTLLRLVMCVLFGVGVMKSQTGSPDRDPLQGSYALGRAADVALLWAVQGTPADAYRNIYHYLSFGNPALSDSLLPSVAWHDTGTSAVWGGEAMDAATGDFDGDNKEDVIYAWEGPDKSIESVFPTVDPDTRQFTNDQRQELAPAGSLTDTYEGVKSQLRLVTGYFDNDPQPELLLAYMQPDGHVKMQIYDTDGSRSLRYVSEIQDFVLPYGVPDDPGMSAHFDVATGDLDADGTDEIVLAGAQELSCGNSEGCWQVDVRVYDVDTSSQAITFRCDTVIYTKNDNSNRWLSRIAVSCGHLTSAPEQQIAVIFEDGTYDATVFWYLQPISVAPDLSALVSNTAQRYMVETNIGDVGFALALQCADLDGDGMDEIVYGGRSLKVFATDSLLNIHQKAGGSFSSDPSEDARRWMAVADLDADADLTRDSTDWRPEIVMATNRVISDNGGISSHGEIALGVFSYTPGQFNLQERTSRMDDSVSSSGTRELVLAAADFGARGIRVGIPHRYTVTNIVEPLVILNAPPTHFDVLGGTAYDITGCATGGVCGFSARYETQTQRTISMSTEFTRDWSVGAKVSGGFKIPIIKVGVEAKLKTEYGENFSRYHNTSQTFTISQAVTATLDDQIYAAIVDYDLWEYPLISDGALDGYILVTIPKSRTRAWFDSKSFNANDYIPPHEVGEILSYKDIAAPGDNPMLAEEVRWSTADQYTIAGTTNYEWGLTAENETETTTQHESFFKVGGSVSFNAPFKFVPDVELTGDYQQDSLSSFTSSVTDQKGLYVDLGAANLTFGNTRYAVTPYAYWAKNGALVLDYAVEPELAAPGFDPTWWQTEYGTLPDPTFILPWRNDRARGLTVSDAQLEQTRDIIFNPANPAPGSTVHVSARVQNFSLLPTTGAVKARFYIGNPDSGGTLITGTDNQTDRFTSGPIAARGNALVETDFIVPSDKGQFLRIYVVLDPDNEMDEVHENNNRGWTVLTLGSPTSSVEQTPAGLPLVTRLEQNFPNPFNPTTLIRYQLSGVSDVELVVFDLLGREVATLVNRKEGAGIHEVIFDAAGLSSGVYFYRLAAGDFVSTRKLLLLK